jgi:hypothetical protein
VTVHVKHVHSLGIYSHAAADFRNQWCKDVLVPGVCSRKAGQSTAAGPRNVQGDYCAALQQYNCRETCDSREEGMRPVSAYDAWCMNVS